MATYGRQLAHIWAQQTKQNGKGYGAIRFEGDTLYSYAEPIARIIEKHGARVALLRDRTFSVTTSKHQSYARSAVSHLQSFSVPDLMPNSDSTRKNYESKIKQLALDAARARKNGEFLLERAEGLAHEANSCAKFFGWKWRLDVPTISPEVLADMRAKAKAANLKEKQRRQAIEKARQETLQNEMRIWLQGGNAHMMYQFPETLLRINGDKVQTSKGAEIPVSHARRVWPAILKCQAEGVRWQRNGHTMHVGEFSIDSIEADGTIKAGCHIIGFDQVSRIAKELGLA